MTNTKLTGYTPDIAEENIAALRQLFPEICCEERIDFEKLRQLLGEYVEDEKERYNFTWNGKGKALRISQQPTRGTLRPCPEESKDWDTTQNLYIEGDNLEVLKLLQKSYHGKVKMIYIDPPYNTGNDFVYPDDYTDNLKNYLEMTGQTDGEGKAYSSNPESSGKYHTKWLNMMYPRLRLARNLLRDDGVIFISIDDHEVENLRKICDEIFGDANFISQLIWKKKAGGGSDSRYVAIDHEYILVYAKLISKQPRWFMPLTEAQRLEFKFIDENYDKWGPYKIKNLHQTGIDSNRPNLIYPIMCPDGSQILPPTIWRWSKETFNEALEEGRIEFKKDKKGNWSVNTKMYLYREPTEDEVFDEISSGKSTAEYQVKPRSVLSSDTGYTKTGNAEIKDLFGSKYFDYPKPSTLITHLVNIVSGESSIILDFFSGSATTAEGIMKVNASDGGTRQFILIQFPEPLSEKKMGYKAGYKTISEIGKERIRRAGEKIKAELRAKSTGQTTLDGSESTQSPDDLDIGFKVFKLDTSNILAWQPNPDNLNQTLLDYVDNLDPTRSELDLVYELLLKEGLSLTEQIEKRIIAGKNIYSIGYGLLQICLDDHITTDVARDIAAHKPEENLDAWRVIFKDNGFATDSDKLNVREILKTAGLSEDAFRTI